MHGPDSSSGDPYILSPADKPPTTPNALDDEFSGAALDPKWTWVNQGTSTAIIQAKQLVIQPQFSGGGGSSMRTLTQAAPGGDFTITSKFRMSTALIAYVNCHLALLTAADKMFVVGAGCSALVLQWEHFTNPTTYSSSGNLRNIVSPVNNGTTGWLYLRIRVVRSTGNIYADESADGYRWFQLYTETIAGWLGTVDKIGVTVNHQNTASSTVRGIFKWFRVDWTPDYA